MHSLLWTAFIYASPLTNKLRFLRQHNISTDLQVSTKQKWNTGHKRAVHLVSAMMHVPYPLNTSGLALEFGTREAYMLRWEAAESPLKHLHWHGFDSFEGLPTDVESSNSADRVARWAAGAYSTGGKLPNMTCCPNVQLHKGWFNETVGPFYDAHPRKAVAFAHMDADIYSSTLQVLDATFSRCSHRVGTVFAFDELFGSLAQEQHEYRALRESSERWGVTWKFITYVMTEMSPYARAAVQITEPHAPHCIARAQKLSRQSTHDLDL